jgi:hypothetical protein
VLSPEIAGHRKIVQAMKEPTHEDKFKKLYRAYRSVPIFKSGLASKSGKQIGTTVAKKLAKHFLANQKNY